MGLNRDFFFANNRLTAKDDFIHLTWSANNWNNMWNTMADNMAQIEYEFEQEEDRLDKEYTWDETVGEPPNTTIIHHKRHRNTFPGWPISDLSKYHVNANAGNLNGNIDRSLVTAAIYNEAWTALNAFGYTPNISQPSSNGQTVILHDHANALENAMTKFLNKSGVSDYSHPVNAYTEKISI